MSFSNVLNSSLILLKSRASRIFGWCWVTIVTCLIVSRGTPPLVPFLMSLASTIFMSASVYLYNDIIDSEYDVYNSLKKDRPLATGHVPLEHAKVVVYTLGLLGLVTSYLINLYSFAFNFIYFLLFTLYSYPRVNLKKIMVVKEGIITSGILFLTLSSSYAITNSFSMNAFVAGVIASIYLFAAQPAIGDTTDLEADRIQGVKTLASVMSWRRKMQMLVTGVLLVMTLTPLTYYYMDFNMLLPILMTLASLFVLRNMIPLMNRFEAATFDRTYKIAFAFYMLIQLFFVIGSLQLNFFL